MLQSEKKAVKRRNALKKTQKMQPNIETHFKNRLELPPHSCTVPPTSEVYIQTQLIIRFLGQSLSYRYIKIYDSGQCQVRNMLSSL